MSDKDRSWSDEIEAGGAAAVQSSKGVEEVSWQRIRSLVMSDREYIVLVGQLCSGTDQWDPDLKCYERFKDELSVVDGVAMYNGWIVVPGPL